MIIYEVNLKISTKVYVEFMIWLYVHIENMLNHKGLIQCKKYIVESKNTTNNLICLHYYIKNNKFLKNYLLNHSKKMKIEAINKFGDEFSAERRMLLIKK